MNLEFEMQWEISRKRAENRQTHRENATERHGKRVKIERIMRKADAFAPA